MHKCERYTNGSAIKPLKNEQTYEPCKACGLWSRGTCDELCLNPNSAHKKSEHAHVNMSSPILSAIILYSALSFTKSVCIFVTKIRNFSYFVF